MIKKFNFALIGFATMMTGLLAQGPEQGKPDEAFVLKNLNALWKKKSTAVMDPQVSRACRSDRPVTAVSIVTINDHACYDGSAMKMIDGVYWVRYMLECSSLGSEEKTKFASQVYMTNKAMANSASRLGCSQ